MSTHAEASTAGAVSVAVPTRRGIAISSIVLLIEGAVRLTVTAGISFWIAHALGPSQFGVLNFASALMAIFLAVATLGLEVPAVLRLARSQQHGRTLGTLLALRGGAALVALIGVAAIGFVVKRDEPQTLAVTLVAGLAIVGYVPSVLDYWFKAHVDALAPALARMFTTLIAAAAKWAVIEWDLGLVALAWTVVLEAVTQSILMSLAWRHATRESRNDALRVDLVLARSLARESVPYLGTMVAIMLYMKCDVVLLGLLSTHEQTGLFTLVQKLSEALYIVPVVLVDSVYPALARRVSSAVAQGPERDQLLFDLAVGAAIVVAVVAVLVSAPVVRFVFGLAYEASIPLFWLHAWTCIAIALDTARHRWLATSGLQMYAPRLAVFGAVVSLALNVVLIPIWGAWGAAVAAVTAHAASGLFATFAFTALRAAGRMQLRSLWPWGRLARLALDARRAS